MRDPRMHSETWRQLRTGVSALAILGLLSTPGDAMAQDRLAGAGDVTASKPMEVVPTFTEDVAPIFNESCVSCHNPTGIGPMSLLDYETAKQFAPLIKYRVQSRIMPPWHLDKSFGIQEYKNDISLSDEEIETITRWVDAGAPQGDMSKAPAPPELPEEGQWRLAAEFGPPDFVVEAPPYTVRPNSQDQWWTPTTDFEGYIDEPRYVRATEMQGTYPLGVKVLHHGHAQLMMTPDADPSKVDLTDAASMREMASLSRPLGRQGVGKGGDVFPEGTGMLIKPGGKVTWSLHYFPIDVPVPDEQAKAAVWLYPKGYKPEYETIGEERFVADAQGGMPWAGDIVLAPHSYKIQQGFHMLDKPALLSSYRPHMHMRGKEQSLEVIYPDGRRQALSKVNQYSHFWQISYEYADDVAPLLPQGTVIVLSTTWDNTENNPINPDPDQWVVFGQRGVDEMSHAWLGMTYLTQEQFDKLSAARANRLAGKDDN